MELTSLADESYHKKKFYAIDLFKFIFSIAIISLHYPASFITQNTVLNLVNMWFARLAVPFFFIASGYFLFKKQKYETREEQKNTLKKYLEKITKMYIVWSLINLPLVIRSYEGRSVDYIIKKILFIGTYRQFWYLLALIVDVIIIYYLNKKINPRWTLRIGILLFFFGTFGMEFYEYVMKIPIVKNVYQLIFDWFIMPRDAVFFGLCFVAIGNFFANCDFRMPMRKAVLIFVLASITVTVENIFFTKTSFENLGDMRLSLLPLGFCLFYIIAHIELKERKIYLFLRNMSMLIYCSHCILAEGIEIFFKKNTTTEQEYIFGVVFSLIFAFLVVKLRELKKVKTPKPVVKNTYS